MEKSWAIRHPHHNRASAPARDRSSGFRLRSRARARLRGRHLTCPGKPRYLNAQPRPRSHHLGTQRHQSRHRFDEEKRPVGLRNGEGRVPAKAAKRKRPAGLQRGCADAIGSGAGHASQRRGRSAGRCGPGKRTPPAGPCWVRPTGGSTRRGSRRPPSTRSARTSASPAAPSSATSAPRKRRSSRTTTTRSYAPRRC